MILFIILQLTFHKIVSLKLSEKNGNFAFLATESLLPNLLSLEISPYSLIFL